MPSSEVVAQAIPQGGSAPAGSGRSDRGVGVTRAANRKVEPLWMRDSYVTFDHRF